MEMCLLLKAQADFLILEALFHLHRFQINLHLLNMEITLLEVQVVLEEVVLLPIIQAQVV
jgi:hypothetical protein